MESKVAQLQAVLHNESMDKLIIELRRLEEPLHLLKDVIDTMETLLHSGRHDKNNLIKSEWEKYVSNYLCKDKKFGDKNMNQIMKIFGS